MMAAPNSAARIGHLFARWKEPLPFPRFAGLCCHSELVEESLSFENVWVREYFVYIVGSKSGVLYIGVTNDLQRRVFEHQHKLLPGFTKKYNVVRLLYFESYKDVRDAIAREKQLKGWRREKKIGLIESTNLTWRDLSADWNNGRDPSTSSG